MDDAAPQTVFLKDYAPFPWEIASVDLTFRLDPQATRVLSRVAFAPRPGAAKGPFFLHGDGVRLISARIDGRTVDPDVTLRGLTCAVLDGAFVWEAEVEIAPAANTALSGLYMSNGMYCTQCEAEGFRRITFYPDRPDVMAPFRVRVESGLPVLLSNGNPGAQGPGFAEWIDPWPKPAYLFALVAGDLVAHGGQFTTRSGREVALNIWVRAGDIDKCAFAMDALKASMDWDERVYGREYDLDIFNIVAVDDFNMGAMENKGLNIFNAALVLASPATATDADYNRIEAVIAHEYFHNWTGNRITCRDWFQLSLKEGLTVFRDQQFSGDMRGHAVERIGDVISLRARQFREDQGPLAHPVRPESFVEINNFYTSTIYEKGAEVIGMLKRLVGDEAYARALDLYFERHDGQAATIEDWLQVFADTTGRDLTQFKRWYAQAGTPRVTVEETWDTGTLTLTLTQTTPPTPGQPDKAPFVIPIAVGLLNPNGDEVVPTTLLEMTDTRQSFRFEGLTARPVVSALRGFSAPVVLDQPQTNATRAFLLAHDTDPFNRWQAGRALVQTVLRDMVMTGAAPDAAYIDGLRATVAHDGLDPAFRALVLALPSQDETAQDLFAAGQVPDPDAILAAHDRLRDHIARALADLWPGVMADMTVPAPFDPRAADAGKRALGNSALLFLTRLDGGLAAAAQFAAADNMTQTMTALNALVAVGLGRPELAAFETRWQADALVMDKWRGLQAMLAAPDQAVALVDRLAAPPFDWKNPNRFRTLIGAFAGNQAAFHRQTGTGYRLLADWLIRMDAVNPQTAARAAVPFDGWRRYDAGRQTMMQAELARIAAAPGLSSDLAEMVARMRG